MAVAGDLTSMSLTDVLQWASAGRKSGTLEVERNNVIKLILLKDGRVVACGSDDPTSLLGQFLLSRGKIDNDRLRDALQVQEATGENLGKILVDQGALTENELTRFLETKVEETIYGLFDWEDGTFRFRENVSGNGRMIEVDISVEDVLLRGLQRFDEMKRMREIFHDPGIVLRRTSKALPESISRLKMASRIFDLIDGERPLAELLLHARTSEFLVTKFLYQLHKIGAIQIKEIRAIDKESPASGAARPASGDTAPASVESDGIDAGAIEDVELRLEVDVALRLMARHEYEAALEVLHAVARVNPADESVRHLIVRAETAYLKEAQHSDLAPSRIPTVVEKAVSNGNLSPNESFLLSLIDGKSDIKSILWLAPMREIEILRGLKSMLDKGMIELR
jgi:hypothetical protein